MNFKLHKIRQIREAKDIKQDVVAQAAGMSQGTYSRKERGEESASPFTVMELEAIANVLGSEIFEFFDVKSKKERGDSDMDFVVSDMLVRVSRLEAKVDKLMEVLPQIQKIAELEGLVQELKKSLASHRHDGKGTVMVNG